MHRATRAAQQRIIGPGAGTKVRLAAGATDMRCGMGTLAVKVQTALTEDPYSGHVFVFRGRRGDLVKLLWSDGDGMCLLCKRLERSRFVCPQVDSGSISPSAAQLSMLLEVIDWRRPECTWRPRTGGRGAAPARIVAMKDRQVTLLDEQSKQRFNVLYAAMVPPEEQPNTSTATSSSAAPAAPLRPPLEINRKQDFRVGQRVNFVDQSLKRQVGEIKRLNQRTATVHCDGRAWRVGFDLLQCVADVTP